MKYDVLPTNNMDLADLYDMLDIIQERQDRLVKYYLKELKETKEEIKWLNDKIDEFPDEIDEDISAEIQLIKKKNNAVMDN